MTAAQAKHEVQRAVLLDVVVGERAPVLELLPGEDQTLLVRGNAFLVLDLRLHVLDRVVRLALQGDGLSSERLHEDLHVESGGKVLARLVVIGTKEAQSSEVEVNKKV